MIGIHKDKVWRLKIRNHDLAKNNDLGALFNFDKTIFDMYASGSKVVFDLGYDPNSYDLYYNQDYED